MGFDITSLKESEQTLCEKNKQLELLKDVATTANQATTVAQAMQFAVERVCEFTGWPLGHACMPAISQTHLLSSHIWSGIEERRFDAFRAASEVSGFSIAADLPARSHYRARPIWVRDLANDPNFARQSAAQQAGIKSAFAFPVLSGNEVIAVLEFFALPSPTSDDALLEIMTLVGNQLGQVVGPYQERWPRRASSGELLEAAPDAMVVVDRQGKIVLVNAQMKSIFGYGREELLGHAMEMLMPQRFGASTPATARAFSPIHTFGPWGLAQNSTGCGKTVPSFPSR